METLITVLLVAVPTWSVYWLLVRPAILRRLEFELAIIGDAAEMLEKERPGTFARVIAAAAQVFGKELDQFTLTTALFERPGKDSKEVWNTTKEEFRNSAAPIRSLGIRLVIVLFAAATANSPALLAPLAIFFGAAVVLSSWVIAVKDVFDWLGRRAMSAFGTKDPSKDILCVVGRKGF